MQKIIELKNVSKAFDGETVLDNINLDIYDNEFLTLLGPSGCGKTTTLRLIGGFETPRSSPISTSSTTSLSRLRRGACPRPRSRRR